LSSMTPAPAAFLLGVNAPLPELPQDILTGMRASDGFRAYFANSLLPVVTYGHSVVHWEIA
jgi:hypothetical protein